MNASTSSSSPSSTPASSTAQTPVQRRNLAFLRPVLSCGGALLVGGVLVHLFPSAPTSPNQSASVAPQVIPVVLPASEIVQAHRALFMGGKRQMLSGEWKLSTDATGKATISGEVARWVVEPGTHVEAGQSVVEVSSGSASRTPTGAEIQQSNAEKAQIQAADSQTALAQNLSSAQVQLAAAQARVAAAQKRVASAHVLVKRLLAGEKIPSQGSVAHPSPQTPKISAVPTLSREQQQAKDEAASAKEAASKAKDERDAAQKALTKAQKQVTTTSAALTKAENDFKIEKATADVLQTARADADDASSALKEAQTRSDVAEKTYTSRQDKAKTTSAAASQAQIAVRSAPTPVEVQETPKDEGQYMTADQAATMVEAALRETKAATRQADRIHSRVTAYQRQVNQSKQRGDEASKNLQNAQQHVLDSAPRPTFTSTLSPISGTVTWISRLAREVGVGQSVFGISQGRSGYLRFEDSTSAWKNLHVGQTMNAAPGAAAETTEASTSDGSATMPANNLPKPGATSTMSGASASPTQAVFTIRITQITPPAQEGEPAQIDAVRTDGQSPTNEATAIEAELPASVLPTTPQTQNMASKAPVVIPTSVVLPRDGSSYVAVLSPATKPDSQDKVETPDEKMMTLEWRSIHVKSQTAFDVEVTSGLHEGEQVVNQPSLLLAQSTPEEKRSLLVSVDTSD